MFKWLKSLFKAKKVHKPVFYRLPPNLCKPFHKLEEFEIGMLVSTKPGVVPPRCEQPVEGFMNFSTLPTEVMVRGLPYRPRELIIKEGKKAETPKVLLDFHTGSVKVCVIEQNPYRVSEYIFTREEYYNNFVKPVSPV